MSENSREIVIEGKTMNTMRIVLEIAQETKKMRMMMRMMRTQTTLETAWERKN